MQTILIPSERIKVLMDPPIKMEVEKLGKVKLSLGEEEEGFHVLRHVPVIGGAAEEVPVVSLQIASLDPSIKAVVAYYGLADF
jgi:hypothetical protein